MKSIKELTSAYKLPGSVEWIGVRPERRADMEVLQEAEITLEGMKGDHYTAGGKRGITLVQHEHLPVMAAFLGLEEVKPEDLRRNLVIKGFNLLGLRNRQFRVGSAVLEGSGICAPCSRMEETLGLGGYAAVRGHGGITAKIIEPGVVKPGDELIPITD